MSIFQWGLVLSGILLSACGSIMLKVGASRVPHDAGVLEAVSSAVLSPWIAGGVVSYVIPVGVWIYLLKDLPISLLQPLFALVYVLTPLLAWTLLGESVPPLRWIGISVVIVGVILISIA
jgi:drug/metabolite transporter (DMT)-like permease